MSEPHSYLRSLECSACGALEDADQPHGVCPDCGMVLLARYDLAALRDAMPRPSVEGRRTDLWRFHELLPVRHAARATGLGEGGTPLLPLAGPAAEMVGMSRGELIIKDEGLNPTGSFKARGMAVAVARAAELGIGHVALPSAGNAAGAAAAYGAAAGLRVHVAMPADAPAANRDEAATYGAEVTLVGGLIDEAGRIIREQGQRAGWFDLSTLREPYRVEGKKTMGLELAEAGGWGDDWCPDAIVFPTGGGTGIVGMWKAFDELAQLGWIGERRPKMVVVQATGCAPLVRAFESDAERAEPWTDAHTIAAGIRVPSAIGDYLVLRAIRESSGTAVAVDDDTIVEAQLNLARNAGIYAAPEGAAAYAAVRHLRDIGFLAGDERVVVFNTGTGLKYPPPASAWPPSRSADPADGPGDPM